MASIRRRTDRGEGVWQVTVAAGKDPATNRYRYRTRYIHAGPPTAKGDPPRKVKELVGILEAEVRQNSANGADTSLDYAIREYIKGRKRLDRTAKTVRQYETMHSRLVDVYQVGSLRVGSIGVADLDALDSRMVDDGLSRTTRAHYVALISQTLNMAVDLGWAARNPVRKMKAQGTAPSIRAAHIQPPTIEEVRTLIAEAQKSRSPQLASFIFVAATTGMRRGEMCGLTVGAIDARRRQLTVSQVAEHARGGVKVRPGTKTHRARVVGFGEDTAAVLEDQYRRLEVRCRSVGVEARPDRFLWSQELDHSLPWRPDGVTQAFTRLRDRCGLPHIHLHTLRHLAVTRALEAGVDVKTAAARFGHDPSLMLRVYASAIPASDQLAAVAAERGLSPGREDAPPPDDGRGASG